MRSFIGASLLILAVGFTSHLSAHPVFHHHFNNIVNANPCLKNCMEQATSSDMDLSLLKTANITGYLLNLDSICDTISTARLCVASCGIASNPFALESMTTVCTKESTAIVQQVSPCLMEQGDQITNECKTQCGDYDQISEQVHKLSVAFRPEQNQPEKVAEIMSLRNEGCGVLKCSDRCVTKMLSEQCGSLGDGKDVGSIVQTVIERVLVAQRRDLERMQLVDAMAQSLPLQCNFMYMPEVMFNVTKDEMALSIIDEVQRSEHAKMDSKAKVQGVPSGDEEKRKELNLALSQFQAELLRRQLHLMDIQEQNLRRESRKLDWELQILARKRLQPNFEDEMNKQF